MSVSFSSSANEAEATSLPERVRVLIVGAGPAGLGVAAALKRAGVDAEDLLLVDAREVGASFRNWPKQMRLLTPSFFSNAFGLTDLNALDPETSPADYLRTQHPTGAEYARYLDAFAQFYELPIETGVTIEKLKQTASGFVAHSNHGQIEAEFVVWTTGQFFFPRADDFEGSELARHASTIADWSELIPQGEEFSVIGGYESGVDAALNLLELGKTVNLISRGEPWSSTHPDPSRSLSPRTLDRLRDVLADEVLSQKLNLFANCDIERIEKRAEHWVLFDSDNMHQLSQTQPILANGFHGGLSLVAEMFDTDKHDLPVFSEEADESTLTPGLFYAGPELVHRQSLFCFIYKFRARFGVVAAEIAERLGLEDALEKLEPYAKAGFLNQDLDCCTNCQCAIEPEEDSAPEPADFEK